MSFSKKFRIATAGLILVGTATVVAQTPPAPAGPTPAERAIEYRQAVFKIVAGNFGPLSQVAQGKAEFKPEVAAKQATRLSQIATFVGDAHPEWNSMSRVNTRRDAGEE